LALRLRHFGLVGGDCHRGRGIRRILGDLRLGQGRLRLVDRGCGAAGLQLGEGRLGLVQAGLRLSERVRVGGNLQRR